MTVVADRITRMVYECRLNLYKDRFAELQRVIEYTRQRDADAATRSNHLRRAYRDESIALETARIRRTELLEVSDAADAGRKKVCFT